MSISGKISRIEQRGDDIEVFIRPTIDDYFTDDGFHVVSESIPGQPSLTILHPTWTPEIDLVIWGGDGSVLIESKPKAHNYRRIGYGSLEEDFNG